MTPSILIVDDDVAIQELLVEVLRDEGYEVRTASNGHQALAAIANEQPGLVLLDMHIPGKSGWEVLEALRACDATADLPVVVTTAGKKVVAEVEHLAKPFDLDNLLECVARYVQH